MTPPTHDADLLAPPRAVRTELGGGAFVLRSPEPLRPYARCIGEWLEHWARETPSATALAERGPSGEWRRLGYAEVRRRVGAIAQALLDLALPPGAPVVVLSDNSVDHALLMLATMHVGRPVCTVSSAYSRLTKDHTKITGILAALGPGARLRLGRRGLRPGDRRRRRDRADRVRHRCGRRARRDRLRCTARRGRDAGGDARVRGDPARRPRQVPADLGLDRPPEGRDQHPPHALRQPADDRAGLALSRAREAGGARLAAMEPHLRRQPQLQHGAAQRRHALHRRRPAGAGADREDRAQPARGERPRCISTCRAASTCCCPSSRATTTCARGFFASLRGVFYAGAALPQASWQRLEAVARRVRGEPVWFTTSWGSTETSPAVTSAHWRLAAGRLHRRCRCPGMSLKLVPSGDKLEMRVHGVSVFPGYRHAPGADREGVRRRGLLPHRRCGQAGRPRAARTRRRSSTAAWRRTSSSAAAPGCRSARCGHASSRRSRRWAQDIGDHRPRPRRGRRPDLSDGRGCRDCRRRAGEPHARGAAGLALHAEAGGSSQAPSRALVLAEPPSADAGEITDKGYLNQRAVLARRAADVDALHAGADAARDHALTGRPDRGNWLCRLTTPTQVRWGKHQQLRR